MIRINLLPHREEKRRERRQQFYVLLGMVSVLGGLMVFLASSIISGQIEAQEGQNAYLKEHIAALDKEIGHMQSLKEETRAFVARQEIIGSLQQDRSKVVRLLSVIVEKIPEGMYLRSLKQEGERILFNGYAQRSALVSDLMTSLVDSGKGMFEKPQLTEVKSIIVDKQDLYEFTLAAFLKPPASQGNVKK